MMLSTLLKPAIIVSGKKYKVVSQIGEGAFGYVYQVRSTHAEDKHEIYALKKMICQTTEQLDEAKREIDVMLKVQHSNVLPLISFSYLKNKKGQDEVYLLMPLYHASVQSVIDEGFGYPHCSFADGLDVVKILRHCAEGLQALHKAGYRHGDFKPANILISESYHAVLTDFGSVLPLERIVTNRSEALEVQDHALSHSTASYRAPELFDTPTQCFIDGKTDIWAFGCTMYNLFYSRTPFESATEGLSTLSVMAGQYHIPEDNIWSSDYLDLMQSCLTVDPAQRIDITTLQLKLKRICSPPLDLHHVPVVPKPPLREASSSPPSAPSAKTPPPASAPIEQQPEAAVPINFADFSSAETASLETLQPAAAVLEEHMVRETSIDAFGSSNTIFRDDRTSAKQSLDSWAISSEEKLPSGSHLSTMADDGCSGGDLPQNVSVGLDLQKEAHRGTVRSNEFFVEASHPSSSSKSNDDDNEEEDEFGDFATNYVTKRPSVEEGAAGIITCMLKLDLPSTAITVTANPQEEEKFQAVDLLQTLLIEAADSRQVIKEGQVFMMRMGGFPHKLTRKPVWLAVTSSGLVLRKESSPQSKLHETISFHRPFSLTPSDTFHVGINGLSLVGSSPLALGMSIPSTPGTPQQVESEAKTSDEDWIKIEANTTGTQKKIKSRFVSSSFEIAFANKDELNEWMDVLWQQYELCRG